MVAGVSDSIGKVRGSWYGVGVGAVIGMLGGLIGLGGAEFRLPVLIAGYRLAPRRAVPVNLMVSMAVLVAALPARGSAVAWEMILPHLTELVGMLCGSMVAAHFGAGLVRRLSERRLGSAIVALLALLGLVMVGESLIGGESERLVPGGTAASALAAGCGVAIGLVSSVLGVAGGELIIPALVLLFGVPVKLAGSMSILIGLPTIAVGLLYHLRGPGPLREPDKWRTVILPLGIGSILGAAVGGLLLAIVPGEALKILLGLVLLWSAWRVSGHLRHSLA